jgi:hypothetical protein
MKSLLRFSIIMVAFLIVSCSPAREITPSDPSLIYTQAVQTVEAQLTLDAINAALTQTAQPSAISGFPTSTLSSQENVTNTPLPSLTPIPPLIPTDTLVPSATIAVPTPTMAKDDIRKTLGDPDFSDHFEADRVNNNWSLYSRKNVSFELVGQQVRMTAINASGFYGFTVSWPEVYNGYIEMQATTGAECSGLDRYGLIFRTKDAATGYFVGFACDGSYSVWEWDGNVTNRILKWTKDSHILSGPNKTNRLGIKMENEKLTVYANGIALKSVTSATFSGARYGMMIGSVNTPNFNVLVDWIEFWRFDE